jgi:endonuclease/exonuclease/phosphatase family metal-dependent hydrolase
MAEFTLLSLNTFGLPLFLGLGRLTRLARMLDVYPAAVLCFQEIQQNGYVRLLRRGLPDHPHLAYESSTFAPKGGLFTASQFPAVSSHFIAYENRGRLLSAGFADWVLNKGVLVSQFQVENKPVIVMNTHLHANYAGRWDPEDRMSIIQRDQVKHLADIVNQQPRDALVIVCGDFNFPRNTFLYDLLLTESALCDPLANDPRPTYRPFPLLPSQKWSIPIDFCLVRLPDPGAGEARADIVEIQDNSRAFAPQRFLTDHNALTLQISW